PYPVHVRFLRFLFFFHEPSTPEIYTLSLHDALPILRLRTEKYWVLTDPLCDVLATVTFDAEPERWRRRVTMPAVWTRHWGAGRVFVSTVGHRLADLDVPEIRTLTERGLLWATRS